MVYQDLVKISNKAIREGSIMDDAEIKNAFSYAKESGKAIHSWASLPTAAYIHRSTISSPSATLPRAMASKRSILLHGWTRHRSPAQAKDLSEQLEAHCAKSAGKIASVIGRYYAMDRDKRWERVKIAYDLLVNGEGAQATDMAAAVQASYDADVTDEFIKPIHNSAVDGTIQGGRRCDLLQLPQRPRERAHHCTHPA